MAPWPSIVNCSALKSERIQCDAQDRKHVNSARAKASGSFAARRVNAIILIWRLLRDSKCATRTLQPEAADLFLMPTFPARKDIRDWQGHECGSYESDLDRHLPYLDERTAHRHLFLLSKGHPADHCRWWHHKHEREGLPDLLTRAMRVAYSLPFRGARTYGPTPLDDEAVAARLVADPAAAWDADVGFPHTVSMPYTSGIHAVQGTRPWAHAGPRRHLAIYVGRPHGKYGLSTRDLIAKECARAANATCAMFDLTKLRQGGHHARGCGYARVHRSAMFCFQPGGDTPYRKDFYDAMLTGCIPVIFSLQNQLVAPWFVPKGVAVRLSEAAYGNGTFRALDVLRAMAPADVARRQAILREHGHRLQYALDDAERGDAVETLFVGALGLAHDLEALYRG